MNRAERRRNKIKPEKVSECQYTKEELRDFLKKELLALRNETCTEARRRERYARVKRLIDEYEKQNGKSKTIALKEELKNDLENSQDERVKAYVKQRQELASNPVYQKLHSASYKNAKETSKGTQINYTTKRAMSAYESQIAYTTISSMGSMQRASARKKEETVTIAKETSKKGFLRRILDWFRKDETEKKVQEKPNIAGVKTMQKPVRYTNHSKAVEEKVEDKVWNDFEERLRDMRNYSKTNPVFIKGRKANFEPRYL